MNEDELLLLFSFILYWGTFAFLFIKTKESRAKKRVLTINLTLHIFYSLYFMYGLFYKSNGGSALVWWFYLLVILWTHWIINVGQLIFLYFKSKNKNNF